MPGEGEAVVAVKPPSAGSSNKAIPIPRMLLDTETHQSITAWEVSVKNFYRKDESYYPFVNAKTKWDADKPNYGMIAEHADSKLKRDAEEMGEDVFSFLQIIAGYVPGDHLRVKIEQDSTDFKSVIQCIREFYDAEINTESSLDFIKMTRKPQEPHRQFYERLASHVREHMVGKGKVVGSIKSPDDKNESMTLTLLNIIAQVWLSKTDPRLVDIVKKEYGAELQKGKLLAELVPDIAKNIDNLLKKNDAGAVNNVRTKTNIDLASIKNVLDAAGDAVRDYSDEEELEEAEIESVNMIKRIFRKGKREQSGRPTRPAGGAYRKNTETFPTSRKNWKKKQTCPHCEYASEVHRMKLDTDHSPTQCTNTRIIARMVMASEPHPEDSEEGDINSVRTVPSERPKISAFQDLSERRVPPLPYEYSEMNGGSHAVCNDILPFKDFENSTNEDFNLAELTPDEVDALENRIRRVVKDRLQIRKEKSPAIQGEVRGTSFVITIDEGAELNLISADLAQKSRIPIIHTGERAMSADGNGLKVLGQTAKNLSVYGLFEGTKVELYLGPVLVVSNLEAELLLGEPGKVDNKLWTVPHRTTVKMIRNGRKLSTPYYSKRSGTKSYSTAKVTKSVTVEEGELIKIEVPAEMQDEEYVYVVPRLTDQQWFKPMVRRVKEGMVSLKNISADSVRLIRGRSFGEIRSTRVVQTPTLSVARKVITVNDKKWRYKTFASSNKPKKSYLEDVQLDPDGMMDKATRERFLKLLEQYEEVIDPAPGKYNGFYGDSDTKIKFVETPPPMDTTYSPDYSLEMVKTLADKLDKLIEWGVLVRAEDIGITVEHIAPSLLVPKTDGDGFRLVNDFSRLNNFIQKLPASSPTIQDAQNSMARKSKRIDLDLSNYFYQGGMRREDAQYLGVEHPFNGLYVYACEPQGLKNASEHAYMRLGRIFGDMVREDRLTRHADGIHVLGDDYEELYDNFAEVLKRLKNCGMTLKPSKVIISPHSSVLFGWRLEGSKWSPTAHTTSALAKCEKPTTVKKMRSFLGAFKQFTALVPEYAVLLHPLEMVQAGRQSSDKIEWNDELTKAFEAAQAATANLEAVHTPRPTDEIHTYSDYSEEAGAVGGKMIVRRKDSNGQVTELLAGHYSCKLDKHKKKWLPCEGEAAGIKMTLKHFTPWIIDNNGVTTHHTDNQPCVQAWARLKKGAFSSSSRIASFLSELSGLPVNLEYKPGKDMNMSDFASRNPVHCSQPEVCQVCRFAREMEKVGDESSNIRHVTVEDVSSGRAVLPLTQKKPWVEQQFKDSVHEKLRRLIKIGQSPNKHKTNGEHTTLKRLHTMFTKGDLIIDRDDAIMVKAKQGAFGGYAISIPQHQYPGLVHTLHIRLGHPSKAQLAAVAQRYFYTCGWQGIIDKVTENCLQCSSLKVLPKVLLEDSTEVSSSCGLQFSADVMERSGQKVLIVREKLTSFMWASLIPDQKADTLETALLTLVLPVTPSAGAVIRTDDATAFQSLASREDSELTKNNIKIELGRIHNPNKNPVAENAVKEFEKEIKKYDTNIGILRPIDISIILKNINMRVRYQGLSSQEMLLKREMMANAEIPVKDSKLSEIQLENRMKQSSYQKNFQSKNRKETPVQEFSVGDFVFIRNGGSKHKARELHVVSDITKIQGKTFIAIRKAQYQLRNKTYLMLPQEIIHAPITIVKQLDDDKTYETSIDRSSKTETEAPPPVIKKKGRGRPKNKVTFDTTPLSLDLANRLQSRPGRAAKEAARERLRNNCYRVKDTEKKKRNVNPCLNNPYEEDIFVEFSDDVVYQDSRTPRYCEDILGWGLLADSFEDDEDYNLNLLELDNAPAVDGIPEGFDDEESSTETNNTSSETVVESENDLQWDDSPEQIDLQASTEEEFQMALLPRDLFGPDDDLEDEVFSNFRTPPTTPYQGREDKGSSTSYNFLDSVSTPTSPSRVILDQTQNLENVLRPRNPIVPESVDMSSRVQTIPTTPRRSSRNTDRKDYHRLHRRGK